MEGLFSPPGLLLSNSSKPWLSPHRNETLSLLSEKFTLPSPKTSENSGLFGRNHESSDRLASSRHQFIPSGAKAVLGLSLPHFLLTSCLPSLHQTLAKYIKKTRRTNFHRYLLQKGPRRPLQHPQIKYRKPLFTSQNTQQLLLQYLTLLRVRIINISLFYLGKYGIKHPFVL